MFVNRESNEVVLYVVAPSKGAFDETVMTTIQGRWSVVKSTRTLISIGGMAWKRARRSQGLIFVSVAQQDLSFGRELTRQLQHDTGLECWTFSDIPIASGAWPTAIDDVIKLADLHLFLLSDEALLSQECQREFGRIDATALDEDVCCLLLPECEPNQLPVRYQVRQCLKLADPFGYRRLVEWLEGRLSFSR